MTATPFVARAGPPQNDAGTGADAPGSLDWRTALPQLGNGTYTGMLDPPNNDTGDAYEATTPYCVRGNVTVHIEGAAVQVRLDSNWGAIIATPADFRIDTGCERYRVEPTPSAPSSVLTYTMVISAPLPPPLPDFKLVSVNVTQAETVVGLYPTHHQVRVTVANIGDAAGNTIVETWALGKVPTWQLGEYIGSASVDLDAGGSTTLSFEWNSTGDVGTFDVDAYASAPWRTDAGFPGDTNFTNNEATTRVTIGAPIPGGSGVAGAPIVNFAPNAVNYSVDSAKYIACGASGHQLCP